MTFAVAQDSSDWRRSSPRRRATAIALTLAAELIFLLILLGLTPTLPEKILTQPTVVSLDLSPQTPATSAPEPKTKAKARAQSARPTLSLPTPKPPPLPPSPLVALSKAEMAASDISDLGSHAPGASAAGASAAYGPGEGPGGAHLYNAEWYREPTNGELAYYLPKGGVDRGSWAQIGCQTIAHYHVDNCVLLGESPPGSGLARAMRLAAWQFLVRPPNIDGKPLVGSWVRIRIDFSERADL
ncbi:MAG: hypothetical protein ABI422_08065 [Sphingomicrobium sp.]